jgi:hypothetical protein
MEFEFTWIEPSLVSVRTSGLASAGGFAALYEKLAAAPGFGPGVKILSDHTNLDVSGLNVGEVEKIAASRERWAGSLSARSALVVGISSPVRFGLARMFEALAASEGNEPVRVFETTEEAIAWLRGTDPAAP